MSSASSVSDKVAQDAYVGSEVDSIPPPLHPKADSASSGCV